MLKRPLKSKNENSLIKIPWVDDEDQIIEKSISEGISKWSEIAKRIPNRIGKQCRERWFNHLDPNLKKSPWNEEEDLRLIEAQFHLGNCWTKIATYIPGRSENEVKNRWYSAPIKKQVCMMKLNENSFPQNHFSIGYQSPEKNIFMLTQQSLVSLHACWILLGDYYTKEHFHTESEDISSSPSILSFLETLPSPSWVAQTQTPPPLPSPPLEPTDSSPEEF